MFHFDLLFEDLFSQKMIFDWNVLGFLVHDRVFTDTYYSSIVIENRYRLRTSVLSVLQCLNHP